jgi:hypothetical protein
MSEELLNIPTEDNNQNQHDVIIPKKSEFLGDLPLNKISRIFADFGKENRVVAIPVGFPQAGKSLFLSSLIYYFSKSNDKLFIPEPKKNSPFENGSKTMDQMVQFFDQRKLYQSNAKGTLDLIGLDLKPFDHIKRKLPILKVAFLDLAGEDLKKIKISEGGEFPEKINAVFNGIKIDNSPLIFILITPFQPPIKDDESLEDAHNREDALHFDFINYLKENQAELLLNAKFFILVTQWDKNPSRNQSVESFIQENRKSVYSAVRNSNVFWGEYSIGRILETRENGVNVQEIIRINYDYPNRFWKKLYKISTNKDLDQQPWWKKLFG